MNSFETSFTFDTDDFGEIINGIKTYHSIAYHLVTDHAINVGWSDGLESHLDILFAIPIQFGKVQRGVSNGDLHVSVQGFGQFAFDINENEIHPGYTAEKLRMCMDDTIQKLTILINEVRFTYLKITN